MDHLAINEQNSLSLDLDKQAILFDCSVDFFNESSFWNVSSIFNFFYENIIYYSDNISFFSDNNFFFSNNNSLVLYNEFFFLDNFFSLENLNEFLCHKIDFNFFYLVRAKGLNLKDPTVSFFIDNPIDNLQILEKFLFFSNGIIFEEFFKSTTAVKFLLNFFFAVKGLFAAKDYSLICIKANDIANTVIDTAFKHNDLNILKTQHNNIFLKTLRFYFEKLSFNFINELQMYLFEKNITFSDLQFSDLLGFYSFFKFFDNIFRFSND